MADGEVATTADDARRIAARLARPVVVKAQILLTKRAGLGGIAFAATPDEAAEAAGRMLGAVLGGIRVDRVLVEARQQVAREYFASIYVDDATRGPVLLVSASGGAGIEELAQTDPGKVRVVPIDPREGLLEFRARDVLIDLGVPGADLAPLADALVKLYQAARACEARSAEINPLAVLTDGRVAALDARFAVDDNAVFRHPELGIEVAREFSHAPTALEKVAWQVESRDYRGTFYFTELRPDTLTGTGAPATPAGSDTPPGADGLWVGFHGAGGGGAMMAMDALSRAGIHAADFCDTSGNPPASKVYRAARVILSQPGIRGYFYAGSGVASQEQDQIARGLAKAFRETGMSVPAVLRFGGNGEDLAVQVMQQNDGRWPGAWEAYTRKASVDLCAARLNELMAKDGSAAATTLAPAAPTGNVRFATLTGSVVIDHERCRLCAARPCLTSCPASLLAADGDGLPMLGADKDAVAKGKCTECLSCEMACLLEGQGGLVLDLPLLLSSAGAGG